MNNFYFFLLNPLNVVEGEKWKDMFRLTLLSKIKLSNKLIYINSFNNLLVKNSKSSAAMI